ncbi:predicted protein [Haematococcus lacustris]|uniref:Uncharacterized protein n=1 Tax=Haematococcus lacustris TaxID=44745 RepID=A0A699Y8A7_HAELA|nr:predicted protein [Haematococcus lacustris]
MKAVLWAQVSEIVSDGKRDPGDTVKAQLQVQGSLGRPLRYTSTRHAVAQAEGLAGFYKGFGAVLVGNVPANMAYFGGYELARSKVPGEL